MKGNMKFGIGLLLLTIIVLGIIQAGQKEPIDWSKTFNPKDKIPFGTYVIDHDLETLFEGKKNVERIHQSLYSFWGEKAERYENKAYIFIGKEFNEGKESVSSLMHFVRNGNNALIASYQLDEKWLEDSLGLSIKTFSYYTYDFGFEPDSIYYKLVKPNYTARFDKNHNTYYFDKIKNKETTTILGWMQREDVSLPNFVRIKYGKGNLYIQLTPDVYSNYFMLNPENYPIAYHSLQYLEGDKIFIHSDWYGIEREQSPLRFILSQPALRWAWYLLLFTLILFLIFKSRREQAAIPIVEPEKNLSVEFAETIGSLYYESGQPGNMIQKKIEYFLYSLKKDYGFDEIDINNAAFRQQAILRLNINKVEIDAFFNGLKRYQKMQQPQIKDLKAVQKLIEDFKQKLK